MFIVDIRTIPENGTTPLQGSLEEDICGLPADDPAQPVSPLTYKVEASIVSGSLLLQGDFSITFKLHCVRCLSPFEHRALLADHSLLVPIESGFSIDLTDALREDIILALPNFPRCDQGGLDVSKETRECPAAGNFQAENSFAPLDPEQNENDGSDTWGPLDNLKLD